MTRAGAVVPSRRATVAVAFVAIWALLAVSCGSGGAVTKDEYAKELTAAMADVEEAYGDAGSALDPETSKATTADRVGQLRATQIAIRDAGNRLDQVTPPADLQAEHDDLVAGVRDMADAVDLLIDAQELAETDPARAKELTRRFATDDAFETVVGASAKIRDAGVDVENHLASHGHVLVRVAPRGQLLRGQRKVVGAERRGWQPRLVP